MRRQRAGRRAARGLVAFVVLASLVSLTPPASPSAPVEASVITPFAKAHTENFNLNGSIAIFGNNLMSCQASTACTNSRNAQNDTNNNGYDMEHIDQDGAAFNTYSSSSADVVLPADATVRWAGLYWGARLNNGTDGADADGDGRQMRLRVPGDTAYRTRTADRLFGPSTTTDRAYQGFDEVTSIVDPAAFRVVGNQRVGTFWGADVPAGTGRDRYAGWALVVVFRSPGMPLRNLTVFHGLADVGQRDPQSITVSGFRTPAAPADVNARLGMIAYEGDFGSTGDRAELEDTQLATTESEGTNFFNGHNDDNGTPVTARDPAHRNMLGFDIKNLDVPRVLPNGAVSARVDLESTSERYFPGVVTTAIDVFAPDFSKSTKSVTNLTGGSPARVGDRLRYTVTFVNNGQDPAVNTSVVDPIPPGTSYVPGSLVLPAGVTGTFNSALNRVQVSPGTFAVNRSVTFTFDVDVGAAAADTDVANQATITYNGQTVPELGNLQFATRAASITVVPSADLVVTKVNSPDPVIAGNLLTSTITVSNSGPSPATDVVVTDELPAGVTGVVASSTQGTCTPAVRCTVGTVAAGATVTITVRATVPPDSTAASLTNVARVESATSDPDPADNTAPATSNVTRDADLAITKTAEPETVTPGEDVTYTITVVNSGPSAATSVVIDDDVPDPRIEPRSASSDPPGACTTDPSNARCSIGSLAPGATAVMTVRAIVLANATPGAVANDAIVSSATPDSDPENTATDTVTIGPPVSDLDVNKTADAPTPLVAGVGTVRYSIDVTNNGPSDADPVTVSDNLPAGFVAISATTDRGTCTVAPDGGSVSCAVGRLLAPFDQGDPGSARVTIIARVPADVAPGDYPNVATADAPSSPPTASPPAPVTVSGLANVSVVKAFPQGSDPDLTPGARETYRIRVVNDGPSVARALNVTDNLPANLTAPQWTIGPVIPPGPTPVCDNITVSCALGDLPPGTTVELELSVLVGSIPPGSSVENRAEVVSDTDDPNDDDNTSLFVVGGAPRADLSIRKFRGAWNPENPGVFDPVESPIAGDNSADTLFDRSFMLEVANFGPSDAPGVVITDVLPPGVSFVRVYEPTLPELTYDFCTGDGAEPQETVTCVLPFDLPAFVGTVLGIELVLDPTIPEGTVLENTSSVDSALVPDGNPGNDASTAVVPVRTEVNLRVEKQVIELDANGNFITFPPVDHPRELDPLGVPAGRAVSFVVSVTNEGPSAASDVQFIDSFPVDGEFFDVGDCDFLNGETVCPFSRTGGLLPPGETFGVQLLTVLEGDVAEGVYTNTARATTSTNETNLDDNDDVRPIEVIAPEADLIIEKDAVTSPLVAGETFTYQISVSAGVIDVVNGVLRLSSDAQDVEVTDVLPAGLVPAAATASQGLCAVSGQTVTCNLGTVESSISLERQVPPTLITVTGTVAPGITDEEVTNTATASTSTPLLDPDTPVEASVTTPIERRADLAVTKVADSSTAAAGGGVTFTVTVTNTGPSDATGVVVTDLLPAPLVFSTATSDDDCAVAAGDVVCNLGTLAAGSSRAITIGATLPADADPGSVTNTASVTSEVADPDATDDSASVPIDVVQAADLSVTKTAAAEGVLLGSTMAYTLLVANEGPSDAADAVLTESIPAGTVVVAPLPDGCTGSDPVTCDLGDIAAGETRTLEIVIEVPETTPLGPLPNSASVSSATDDPDQDDNTATATVEAIAQADVILQKTLVTSPAVAGQPLVYELTLTNRGPTIAPSPSLSDPLPTGTTFASFTAPGGECQLDPIEGAPSVSCSLAPLPVGASVTATLTVNTDPDLRSVANTGFSGSGGLDVAPLDNEDTVATPLQQVADLRVSKSGPAAVTAGGTVQYVIEYHNDGPSTATDVVVTDTLPTGLTARPVKGCTISGNTVSCAVDPVAPGGTGSLTLTADVGASLPAGTELTDVAAIRSDAEGSEDPDDSDNTSRLSSTVRPRPGSPPPPPNDVAVTVTADQDEVRAGARASFTVVVTNNGPQRANAAVLTNELPARLRITNGGGGGSTPLLPQQVPPECSRARRTAGCTLGDLAVGATRTLVFSGRVAASTPAGGRLVHRATVTFDGTDSVEANNTDSDVILVVAQPAPTTTTTAPSTTTTSPAVTTTTVSSGGSGGGGGSLPVVGAAIAGLFAVATVLVVSGGGLRTIARWGGPLRRRPDQ